MLQYILLHIASFLGIPKWNVFINQEWSGIFIAKNVAIHVECALNLKGLIIVKLFIASRRLLVLLVLQANEKWRWIWSCRIAEHPNIDRLNWMAMEKDRKNFLTDWYLTKYHSTKSIINDRFKSWPIRVLVCCYWPIAGWK